MNKADFITLVNTKLPDGGNIPSVDHRATMHTDPNSTAEIVYGSTVNELTSGTLVITSAGDFDYTLQFQKVGRFISVSGVFSATAVIPAGGVIANIIDSDWDAQFNTFNGTAYGESGETIRIYANGSEIRVGVGLLDAESFAINTLIYNAAN